MVAIARRQFLALLRLLKGLGLLALLVTVLAATAGLLQMRSRAIGRLDTASAARPDGATVLHARAVRTGPNTNDTLEAWLDLATGEGKIVEAAPDGTVRRVVAVVNNTHTLYLADRRHAVIRQGFGPNSPHAGGIRDELLGARRAADQGKARVIGSSSTGGRATDRVQTVAQGGVLRVDIDRATGLVLREEMITPGSPPQIRETSYSVIEHLGRTSLPMDTFAVSLPGDIGREEYTDGDPNNPQASSAGLPYAVYALPAATGVPVAAFRIASTTNGLPPRDGYYLIYNSADGQIQVVSGLAPNRLIHLDGGKPVPLTQSQTVQFAGVAWEVQSSGEQFQASAQLAEAFVAIHAPSRAAFERVAASLQRLDR